MHFIISSIGSAGDVHPMLGLALLLRDRGHEVTLVACGYFRELVEAHELDLVELGTSEEFLEVNAHRDVWDPARAFAHIFDAVLKPAIRPLLEIHEKRNAFGRTVAISNCLGFGARIAQEVLSMPLVTVHLAPSALWSDLEPPELAGVSGSRSLKSTLHGMAEELVIDPMICPAVNAVRAEFGLPPMTRTTRWWHSPDLILCMFPEWFAAKQRDWPAQLVCTDFPLWDEDGDARLAADVAAFLDGGDAPIVFTPGSANRFGASFFEAAAGACQVLRRRGMLLTRFAEQVPSALPPGVRHFSYVPFEQLLPRAAALVHHGGIGSSAQAMAAGIPQLVMPLLHDQFDNAARLERLGVAERIQAPAFLAPAVAEALERLLSSDSVERSCRSVAERLAVHDGLSRSAAAVEAFAAARAEFRAVD
jgi:rhamnosyltransferase subunit B